ncbi:MAG: phosphate ABC transporter substrate-binding protein [Candidatus Eisenbacteria bacterium]
MKGTWTARALIAGLLLTAGVAAADWIVVVVHPGNPVTDLSKDELRRFYQGKVSAFPDGRRVLLGVHSKLSERFYDAVLGMSANQFRKHWIKEVFSGSAAAPPEPLRSDETLLEFVAGNPGAIAFVNASAVNGRVKVITVGGAAPGDRGYPRAMDDGEKSEEPVQ